MTTPVVRPMAEIEREAILAAVSTVGDKLAAARLLGIGKTTLYRKLKDFGVETTRPRPSDARVRIQAASLGELAATSVLLRQASALRTVPVIALHPEKKVVRFLQIPSTLLEQEQASLRCPKCQAKLIDATRVSA